jgi:hypothetical protein
MITIFIRFYPIRASRIYLGQLEFKNFKSKGRRLIVANDECFSYPSEARSLAQNVHYTMVMLKKIK